jgi:anti-anti-sigma factor
MMIRVWADGRVWVVEPLGNLTAVELPMLLDQFGEAAADTRSAGVVLMLNAVNHVDAAAIGALRAAREALAQHGGRLLLTGAHTNVERALSAAGLSGSGTVCQSLQDALNTLKGSAG